MNEATKLLNEGKNNEFKSKCNEWVRKYSTIYNKQKFNKIFNEYFPL